MSIDHLDGGAPEIHRKLAQLTGTQARLKVLERRYQEQIKGAEGDHRHTQGDRVRDSGESGKINAMHSYHSLGRVLRDAGFTFPPLIEHPGMGRIDVSAERCRSWMPISSSPPARRGYEAVKPQDELAAMDAVMPGWCQFLNACRTGHYVLISREEAISRIPYASLGLMAQVQSQIAGRPLPEAK